MTPIIPESTKKKRIENMSLRILLRRGSTTEALNMGLFTEVIKANNLWIKRDGIIGGGRG